MTGAYWITFWVSLYLLSGFTSFFYYEFFYAVLLLPIAYYLEYLFHLYLKVFYDFALLHEVHFSAKIKPLEEKINRNIIKYCLHLSPFTLNPC